MVVLSKADLPGDRGEAVARLARVALGAPVVAVSALHGEGLAELRRHVGPGRTAAFLGSSGVGKSTLINALLGEAALATSDVREGDDKGRHTTTHRSLWLLPEGGVVIDTPGMRELMPLADDDAVAGVFAEVDEVVVRCRFSNCRHAGEPGCAVSDALASGALDGGRYAAWEKAQREQAHLARKADARLAAEDRRKWKKLSRQARDRGRAKRP